MAKRRIMQIMPHDSFQVRIFVVAGFLLTSASRIPSAIAELLVQNDSCPSSRIDKNLNI